MKKHYLVQYALNNKFGVSVIVIASEIMAPHLFENKTSTIPPSLTDNLDAGNIDYSRVEDISNIDYKIPIVITSLYLFLYFFMDVLVLKPIGIVLATLLAGTIWNYFNTYFPAVGDKKTSIWVKWMIATYVIFGAINLFAITNNWEANVILAILDSWMYGNTVAVEDIVSELSIIEIGLMVAILIVFLVGFRLVFVSKKHALSLKRIAFSSMIFIPLSFFINLSMSVGLRFDKIDSETFAFFF